MEAADRRILRTSAAVGEVAQATGKHTLPARLDDRWHRPAPIFRVPVGNLLLAAQRRARHRAVGTRKTDDGVVIGGKGRRRRRGSGRWRWRIGPVRKTRWDGCGGRRRILLRDDDRRPEGYR